MSTIVKIHWYNNTPYENESEDCDIYSDNATVYWEDDSSVVAGTSYSTVTFDVRGGLLFMRSRYSNEQGILESNWCLGYFHKNNYAKQFAEYVMQGYAETSNLAHCPAVVYVEWDGADAYTLGGELITKETFCH